MEMLKQGKGTADHLLPLGDWFLICAGCEFMVQKSKGPLTKPDLIGLDLTQPNLELTRSDLS